MTERLVLVARVSGAFGVNGEVRVRTYTDQPTALLGYGSLLDEHGAVVLSPARGRALADGLAITAPEITTREAAQALKGVNLYVPRRRLPAPGQDEFYAVDLVGCRVEHINGAPLGAIKGVHDFGAGDILEIVSDGRTWFLPFTMNNAPSIDIAAGKVIVNPPPDFYQNDEQP